VDLKPLPCPFCGSHEIYVGRGGVNCPINIAGGTWSYGAGCKIRSCGAIVEGPGLPKNYHKTPGSIERDRPDAIRKTIEKWNRRPSVI
jgi:hypothetical protein